MDIQPLLLTFKLALITTFLLFVISVPIAYWMAYTHSRIKPFLETLISMPLVLPPTVLGFYLLVVFSPEHSIGAWLSNQLGVSILFSFQGLIIASLLYSLPFMVHPIQSGFSKLGTDLIDAAAILGKSRWMTLFKVLIPNIKTAMLTGVVLTFAHTIGEFGVVLMIGGNIPGETKVASIAIYEEVEALNYAAANFYAGVLIVLSFVILLLVYTINGGYLNRFWKS